MRFATFILGAVTAPQLTSAWPLLPDPLYRHKLPQVTEQVFSLDTPTYTDSPNSAHTIEKRDMTTTKPTIRCASHGAHCVRFPLDAPNSNETVWIRVYCHRFKKHHHHHHHHPANGPYDRTPSDNSTEFPVMMYPCPKDTRCRVNNLPRGYKSPKWLDNKDPNPVPDPIFDLPDPVTGAVGAPRPKMTWIHLDGAADSMAVFLDEEPDAGDVETYAHTLPWWEVAFTCVHKDDEYEG